MPPVASASSWGAKLETKLSALAATSSKETLQTLAKWIAFNRKRADDFLPVLLEQLQQAPPSRQLVLLGVVHEVLLAERAAGTKWDRLEALRLALGEGVLLPVISGNSSEQQPKPLDAAVQSKLQEMFKEWDNANVFGGPTLLNQLRKHLSKQEQQSVESDDDAAVLPETSSPVRQQQEPESSPAAAENKTAESKASSSLPKSSSPTAALTPPPLPPPTKDESGTRTAEQQQQQHTSTTSTGTKDLAVAYDFERHGIPAARVDPREFQEPCRAIATLQIARDLRNDGVIQLSSMLSAMPEDIRAACAKAAEQDNHYELTDEATASDYSLRVNPMLLDMDLDEQLQNAQTFRGIVDRQRKAREQLIELLVQSRCQFGAHEAAEAFYQADRAKAELLRRKQILTDAMDLEGLDVMEETEKNNKADNAEQQELPPLTWYMPKDEAQSQAGGDGDSEHGAKKLRVE